MDDSKSTGAANNAEAEVTIKNAQGLHARPAAQFVRIASKFPNAELTVVKDALSVNGKSIIGIMMLAAGPGTTLTLRAQGEEAGTMLKELEELVDSLFGEEAAS